MMRPGATSSTRTIYFDLYAHMLEENRYEVMKRRMLRVEMERRREEERKATKAMLDEAKTAAGITARQGRVTMSGPRRRASIMHVGESSFNVRLSCCDGG